MSIAETATVATSAVAQDVIAAVRAAEMDLLSSDTRHDARRVRSLLHPDFREIGRSGRMWTRSDVLIELLEEPTRRTPETDDWAFEHLAPTIVLATYRVGGPRGGSRHSSIWDVSGPEPALRFHQGTRFSDGSP